MTDEMPSTKECDAILGILKEGEKVVETTEEDTMLRDVAIIIAAQKVNITRLLLTEVLPN